MPSMKRSKAEFKAELEERLSEMFFMGCGRNPKSQEEWISFAKQHGSTVVARLHLEDEFRAAGVNPNVKH